MTSVDSTDSSPGPTREMLFAEVLHLLERTGTDQLSPDMLFLIGDIDFENILPQWPNLNRQFACAKLAIVRDEFAFRFPSFGRETEDFTFGIEETCANRYQSILKRRDPSDITTIVLEMLTSLFPPTGLFRTHRPQGLSSLGVKLVALLTKYAQSVETRLYPYAESFGVPTGD